MPTVPAASTTLPAPQPPGLHTYRQSFQQYSAEQRNAVISITTDEGDVVTLSSQSSASLAIAGESQRSPLGWGMNFSAEAITANSMTFQVQGDLNEEELADIAALYDELADIAEDFYNGDLAGAMNGAMNIGDMGSLASLSATFSHQQVSASRLVSHHPLPMDGERFQQQLREEMPDPAEIEPTDLLRAQWQQIKDFLADRPDPARMRQDKATAPEKPQAANPAREMMARLNETIGSHPRLAPFALPLAHKAMAEQGQNLPEPQKEIEMASLKGNLLNELEKWLAV